ncbi:MAG: hypothetical protein PHE26_05270, partial [Syntrophomonadaceae bacterium]|nr:hypothetical protein [Syntrophomonadaceae bacterium]
LTETENNSGIFTGQVKLKKANNINVSPRQLRARVGETITATYIDAIDADGNAAVDTDTATVVKGVTGTVAITIDEEMNFIVTLEDADVANTGTIAEIINSSVETAGVELILEEGNPGCFTKTFTIDVETLWVDKVLGVNPEGDTITATYIDALNDDGVDEVPTTASYVLQGIIVPLC